jgi:hypothetical protein
MTSSDAEANPERITPIITLTPEEQARLPNQMMPRQPGGMPIGKPNNNTLPPMSGLGMPPLPSITPAPPPNNPSAGYDFGKGSNFFDPLPSTGSNNRTTTDYSSLFPRIGPSSKVDTTPKVTVPKDPPPAEPPVIDANDKYAKPKDDGNSANMPPPPGSPPVAAASNPPVQPAAPALTPEQIAVLRKQRDDQLVIDTANLAYVDPQYLPIIESGSGGGNAFQNASYAWKDKYIRAKLPQGLPEGDAKNQELDKINAQIDRQLIRPPTELPPLAVGAPIGSDAKPVVINVMIYDGKTDGTMMVSSTGNKALDLAIRVKLKPYVDDLIKQGKLAKSEDPNKPYMNYEFSPPVVQQPPVPPVEKPAA